MSVVLTNARGRSQRVLLSETSGLSTPTTREPATGVHYEVAGVGVSLFFDDGGVVLQVGRERFDAGETSVRYRHDFEAGRTRFEASEGEKAAAVEYPAWWAELGLAPDEVMFEPERDEEEDFLAFVAMTVNDEGRRVRFGRKWNPEKSTDPPGLQVMKQAMALLNDPNVDRILADQEAEKDIRQTLVLAGYRARDHPEEPKKEYRIRNVSDLRCYLAARDASETAAGLRLQLPVDGTTTPVTAEWDTEGGGVRFACAGGSRTLRTAADGSISSLAVEYALAALARG